MNIFDDYYKNGPRHNSNEYDWDFNYTQKMANGISMSKNNFNDFDMSYNDKKIIPVKWKNDFIKHICESDNTYGFNNRLSGLSIIITAYNTAQYIEQTLDSFQSQKWCIEHDNYEILIGIDGCESTLVKVKEIMHKYKNVYVYMMSSNMGTFVTSNTLCALSKYDKIMRFDSDDFFINEESLGKVMSIADDYDMISYWFIDYHKPNRTHNIKYMSLGSVLYKASVLEQAGGYVSWRCSGDREFYERVKNNISVYILEDFIFYHRIRQDSLMHAADTSMTSDYRLKLKEIVDKYDYKKGDDIYIKPDTNTYESIMPEESVLVSMTTWPSRINTAHTVIRSILDNTVKPYKIILNLSLSEFPDKLDSIPIDLKELVKSNDVMINWVLNNSLVWKKSLPIIIKYPTSYVICIDDDFIYPDNFIRLFIDRHNEYPNMPITGVTSPNHHMNQHCGCGSLDSMKWIKPYIYDISDTIYKTGDEDTFFTVCYMKNGIKMKPSKINIMTIMKPLNLSDSYSAAYHIMPSNNFDTLSQEIDKQHVEFVTINYNTPDLLEKLLASFNKYSNGNFKFRVIDGSDKEEYKRQSLEIAHKYNADIVQVGYNIHHGPGMDYAITTSKCGYVFIADSDLEFTYDLTVAVNKMLDMKKAITGFNEYVNENGINVDYPYISYIHPRYMLVNVNEYKKLSSEHNVKYVKHGAPCINVMRYIHDNKLADQMLGKLPESDRNIYYKTDESGTCHRFGMNL